MTDTHKHLEDAKHDELDKTLDAALARYAAVEPRAGLEDRVLSTLRAEREQIPQRSWWRVHYIACSMAGALAVVAIVAIALAWRSSGPSHPVVANHSSATTQAPNVPPTQVISNSEDNGVRSSVLSSPRRISAPRSRPAVVASAVPKLDQFPSPQPLSAEEMALVRYVGRFPEEATLIAQAQAEFEKEIQQKMNDPRSQTENSSDQEER
jgi:hypothetical protein